MGECSYDCNDTPFYSVLLHYAPQHAIYCRSPLMTLLRKCLQISQLFHGSALHCSILRRPKQWSRDHTSNSSSHLHKLLLALLSDHVHHGMRHLELFQATLSLFSNASTWQANTHALNIISPVRINNLGHVLLNTMELFHISMQISSNVQVMFLQDGLIEIIQSFL